ncbi:hypothetical protein [Nocardia asteroides]|uniref:hypothetical protein n=1 Tax=Nocardia asteroides TaxID=1824 RepID=UPI001E3C2F64|nr:hypothetical protein [Nocardia asteroides]UGT64438.1 hypothetical protein LTT61_14610 [Nocardia asteroides]
MGQLAFGGQIEQAFFLDVQLLEPSVELGVHGADAALAVGNRIIEDLGDVGDELRLQLEGAVVVEHCGLDEFDGQERQVAGSLLAHTTEEVLVGATPAFGFGVDEPRGAVVLGAAVAE